ncbi:Mitochondrial 2-oxoglutarate malate carrier [Musa troglodytarum]|uniref:Mitochondrial 2-oxoglutarate malate carrier n=1 Tax=Musa troglodytarum TaxID=320322 RepID=A0A9E7I1A7_9LILI|nr:Mitochondrial 2-oxoglutarate malate carrier [Musa troglodytarum]
MAEGKPKIQSGVWRTIKPFVNGGASGMLATCVIQPIDMVKVRIQLGQGSAVQVTKNMLANEGFGSFYKGLSAGLLRQATYTTARLGSFRVLTNKAVEANDGKPLPLLQKAAIGLTAGAIGASVGSPADLALIRMQADATLPAAQRRNYKNAFHALYRIIADEGVLALWKGAGPTVVRAMSLNMGMLASYDQSIELFRDSLGFGEVSTVLGASAVSGFFASACSLPFDYVKTQIQKMQPDATGKYPYTGSLDCVMKTLKSGGPFKFYTGFPVYCVRIAPHVMVKLYDVDILESNSEGRTGSGLIEIRIIGNETERYPTWSPWFRGKSAPSSSGCYTLSAPEVSPFSLSTCASYLSAPRGSTYGVITNGRPPPQIGPRRHLRRQRRWSMDQTQLPQILDSRFAAVECCFLLAAKSQSRRKELCHQFEFDLPQYAKSKMLGAVLAQSMHKMSQKYL